MIAVAAYRRRTARWPGSLRPPALRAGFIGAALAVGVATLANDSGALLLEVGTVYLLPVAGFAWAQARPREPGHAAGGANQGQAGAA